MIFSNLYSYFKTKNIEKSAIIANAAAAIVVGKKGTSFATMEDINNLLKGDKIEWSMLWLEEQDSLVVI